MDESQRAQFLRIIDDMENRMNELGALGTRQDCPPEHAAVYRAEMVRLMAKAHRMLRQTIATPESETETATRH